MRKQRTIKFNLGDLSKSDLKNIGVYKIINTVNGHFYIGSTDRKFSERFKEHCRYYEQYKEGTKRNMHPILWCAYDKYGIENFKVEILECMNNKSFYDILDREEYYIEQLNPEYNICKHPTCGGKPNLGRKLSKEWKQKTSHRKQGLPQKGFCRLLYHDSNRQKQYNRQNSFHHKILLLYIRQQNKLKGYIFRLLFLFYHIDIRMSNKNSC